MKKAGLAIAVLLLLALAGGALWYFFLRPTPTYRAEEILPASTIALLQIPDVDQARAKWGQTPLGKIFQETEVKNFWELPARAIQQKIAATPQGREAEPCVNAIKQLFTQFHGEAFIAFLGFDVTPTLQLQIVAGFDAKKESAAAKKSIEDLAAQFRTQFPKGVREEKKHLGVAYETWSPGKNVVICHARLGNFFLFTTDEVALQTCIDFARGNREGSLKSDPIFQKTSAKVDAERDAFVYLNPVAVFGKFLPLLAAMPQGNAGLKEIASIKAITASCRLDGQGTVDKLFVLAPEAERPESYKLATPWQKKSLPLVSSQTLFYGVTCFDPGRYWDQLTGADAPSGKAIDEFSKLLEMQNIKLREDVFARLGNEFVLQVNWGERDPLPQVYVMAEARDGPGLVTALDRLLTFVSAMVPKAAPAVAGAPAGPNTLEVEGKSIHWITLAPQQGFGIYYVYLEPFVVFGFQDNSMTSYVNAVAKKQFQGFEANAVYKSIAPDMPKSVSAFLYLDNKPLFEKTYNLAAPLAMLGATYLPDQKAVDFTKLPKTDTIARHLTPSVSYQYLDADGFYRYAKGPVPPEAPFLFAGLAAGVATPAYLKAQQAQQPSTSDPLPLPSRPPGAAGPGPVPPAGPMDGDSRSACLSLLKSVDEAKAKWAAANQAPAGTTVFESQIKQYLDPKLLLDGKLVCPLGGEIIIGDVGQPATSTALAVPSREPAPAATPAP